MKKLFCLFVLVFFAMLLFSQDFIDDGALEIIDTSVVIVSKVTTCCHIDIHSLSVHDSFPDAVLAGEYVYFDRTLEYFFSDPCYWDGRCRPLNILSGYEDTTRLRFVIHEEGYIYCGVYNVNQALLMMSDFGIGTASTWGRPLTADDVLTGASIALDYNQNMLAYLHQYLYSKLTDFELMDPSCVLYTLRDRLCHDAAADSSGTAVYGFNLLDFSVYANTVKPIWLLYSELSYFPLDFMYSGGCWYDGMYASEGPNARMFVERNKLWCARCEDTLGGEAIGDQQRGFRVAYIEPTASAMRSRGGSNAGTRAYCYLDGTVAMSIVGCCTRDFASANYFSFDYYPDSIRLETNNTTAIQRNIQSYFRLSVLADSIAVYSVWEEPATGLSPNPEPHILKLEPGWNFVPRPSMVLHVADTNIGEICTDELFSFYIPITNAGDDTLIITTIHLSDTDRASVSYNARIEPSITDSIRIDFLFPRHEFGEFDLTVSLYTNDGCWPLTYLNIEGIAIDCGCTTYIDSVWFYQDTDCNDSNIVTICYDLQTDCPDAYFNVQVSMSADSGVTWDVPLDAIRNHEEAVGYDILPGINCFEWLMSEDMPDIESTSWAVKFETFGFLDTFHIIDSIENESRRYGWGLGFQDGFFYVYDRTTGYIYRKTHIHEDTLALDSLYLGHYNMDLDYHDGYIYYSTAIGASHANDSLIRIDYETGVKEIIYVAPGIENFAGVQVVETNLYVSSYVSSVWRFYRFDLTLPFPVAEHDTVVVEPSSSLTNIEGMAYANGYIWGVNNWGRMLQFDPRTNRVVNSYPVPNSGYGAEGLCWDGNYLWYHNDALSKLYKIMIMDSLVVSGVGYGPLDSRAPRVEIDCPVGTYGLFDTVRIEWTIDDLFFNDDPCSVYIFYCGEMEVHLVEGNSIEWVVPPIYCDSTWVNFRVVARDSFCNWGEASCAVHYDPIWWVYPKMETAIACPGDTILIPIVVDEIEYGWISSIEMEVHFDPSLIRPIGIETDGSATEGWSIVDLTVSPEDGEIRFTVSDPIAIEVGGARTLLYVRCYVPADARDGGYAPIRIADALFNTGNPNYIVTGGMFAVCVEPKDWMGILRLNQASSMDRDNELSLAFGADPSATDRYDAGMDLIILPVTPGVVDAYIDYPESDHIRGLRRDIRSVTTPQTWVIPTFGEPDGVARWNPERLSIGRYTINGIDMKSDSVIYFGLNDTLVIVWDVPDIAINEIDFMPGWNLISLPVVPVSYSGREIFNFSPVAPFGFNSREYFAAEEITPGVGYWVFMPAETTVYIAGLPVDTFNIELLRGWNLIGASAEVRGVGETCTSPAGITVGDIYYYDGASYISADYFEPGIGYWLLASERGIYSSPSGGIYCKLYPVMSSLDYGKVFYNDQILEFGVADFADNSLDIYDRAFPPTAPDRQRSIAYFAREGFKLERDVSIKGIYQLFIPEAGEVTIMLSDNSQIASINDEPVYQAEPVYLQSGFHKLVIEGIVPRASLISGIYPNPFNASVTVMLSPSAATDYVDVYDVMGNHVDRLPVSNNSASWDGFSSKGIALDSGVYLFVVSGADRTESQRVIYIK